MDPAEPHRDPDRDRLAPMYEGLVRQTRRRGERQPLLATHWIQSADGMTWTFVLRDGVRFHDGSTLNAAAVVISFRRLIDPTSAWRRPESSVR